MKSRGCFSYRFAWSVLPAFRGLQVPYLTLLLVRIILVSFILCSLLRVFVLCVYTNPFECFKNDLIAIAKYL